MSARSCKMRQRLAFGEVVSLKKLSARTSRSDTDATQSWHVLYQAALFETDREKIPARIAEAEKAILHRIKELFVVNTDRFEEDQVLDDALYALCALRNCVVPEVSAA